MQFQNDTSIELRPLRVELIGGSAAVSRGLLGWLLGRGPGVVRVAHRWSSAQHQSIAAGPESPLLPTEGPGELLFDLHRRRRLGLEGARRWAQLGLFLALAGFLLLNAPEKSLALLGGEAVAGQTHTVQEGDSLGRVAARWNITVQELRAANQLPNNVIWVGQELLLPLEPIAVPQWRRTLRARLESELTPVVMEQVAQVATVCAWLATAAFAAVPLALIRRRYARKTLWLYDLHPSEVTALAHFYTELESACASGLRTVEGAIVRLEERGVKGLHTTATPVTLTVGSKRFVLLPDRVLLHDGDVVRNIFWDEFVLDFPSPDVMTGQGIGVASSTLRLRTRLFDAVLAHPDPQVLERLERALHLIRD